MELFAQKERKNKGTNKPLNRWMVKVITSNPLPIKGYKKTEITCHETFFFTYLWKKRVFQPESWLSGKTVFLVTTGSLVQTLLAITNDCCEFLWLPVSSINISWLAHSLQQSHYDITEWVVVWMCLQYDILVRQPLQVQ